MLADIYQVALKYGDQYYENHEDITAHIYGSWYCCRPICNATKVQYILKTYTRSSLSMCCYGYRTTDFSHIL